MNKPRYNRISIVLDELRLDQKELSQLVEVSKDTVSRWCRNENQPRLADIYQIAKVLKIDVYRLLEPTEWHKESNPNPVDSLKVLKEKLKQGKTKKSPLTPKRKNRKA